MLQFALRSLLFNKADGGGEGSPNSDPPTFSQEDVNRLAGAARSEGRETATKDLLKDLGLKKVDDIKAALKKLIDLEAANLTETERLKKELADRQAERDAATSERDEAVKTSRAVALASDARDIGEELGVNSKHATQILKLLPDFNADAYDAKTGKAALKTLFEKFLAEEENKHFKSGTPNIPATPARAPKGKTESTVFDSLRKQALNGLRG